MLNKQVGLKLRISDITVKAHRGKDEQDFLLVHPETSC